MTTTAQKLRITAMVLAAMVAAILLMGCTNLQPIVGPTYDMQCEYHITGGVTIVTGADTTFVATDSTLHCNGGTSQN